MAPVAPWWAYAFGEWLATLRNPADVVESACRHRWGENWMQEHGIIENKVGGDFSYLCTQCPSGGAKLMSVDVWNHIVSKRHVKQICWYRQGCNLHMEPEDIFDRSLWEDWDWRATGATTAPPGEGPPFLGGGGLTPPTDAWQWEAAD